MSKAAINGLIRMAILIAIFSGITACGSIGPRPSVPAGDLYKVVGHASRQ